MAWPKGVSRNLKEVVVEEKEAVKKGLDGVELVKKIADEKAVQAGKGLNPAIVEITEEVLFAINKRPEYGDNGVVKAVNGLVISVVDEVKGGWKVK